MKVSVSSIDDSDKGTYFCELSYSTADSPMEISKAASSELDVYFPPTTLTMSNSIRADGTLGKVTKTSFTQSGFGKNTFL